MHQRVGAFLSYIFAHTRYMGTYSLNADFEHQFLVESFPGKVYYLMVCLPREATSIQKFSAAD